MSNHWAKDAVFYHVYPLGACGAPPVNDFSTQSQPRLERLLGHADRWKSLGVNALYLGPVFESSSHGYDTADYFRVDRRLGDNALLARVVRELHARQIRVVLDGVFHHVGREFWAFQELRRDRERSARRSWFSGVRFDRPSPSGESFAYDGWAGCHELVKLELTNPEVRGHLLEAVDFWLREFDIDGLRLDVAESLESGFVRELARFCRERRPDFWLLGEMIHGDYRRLAAPGALDSTTNYECYKGLWSSLNDRNYFEIAHTLRRQFGPHGLYRELQLYTFVDNHDVDRVAGLLGNRRHLFPLYLLLFTMPGVPSIYYGSEWGIRGRKRDGDAALRPELPGPGTSPEVPEPGLAEAIARFAALRHATAALRHGSYRELMVEPERFAFARETGEDSVIVVLNAGPGPSQLDLALPDLEGRAVVDLLNGGERFAIDGRKVRLTLEPCWGRVLRVERA